MIKKYEQYISEFNPNDPYGEEDWDDVKTGIRQLLGKTLYSVVVNKRNDEIKFTTVDG